jgi:hypothetical protein
MGAIAGEKPAAVLEVAFDEIITGGLDGLIGVRFGAGGAADGETELGGSAATTGNMRLELTCHARHLAYPMVTFRSYLKDGSVNGSRQPSRKP